MDLELVALNDGVVYLDYWDSIHGQDRVFELRADGTAHEIGYDEKNAAQYTRIDLVAELRAMVLATGRPE